MINTAHNRHYILRRLELNDLEYAEMVEAGGYDWLNRFYSHVPDMINLHKNSRWFWRWWVNQWDIRDNDFVKVNMNFNPWTLDITKKIYAGFHEVSRLEIRPNSIVIQDVCRMIKAEQK